MRFPEFTGEWKKVQLKDIATKSAEKNKDNKIETVFSNSAIHGIVLQEEYFDRNIVNKDNLVNYYVVRPNDFVYNPRLSNNAEVGAMSVNHTGITGIVSPLYTIFRINNKDVFSMFLECIFKSKVWHQHMRDVANFGARDDRMNIKSEDFYSLPIHIPSLEEQEKIARFLSLIDERIATQNKIIAHLESLIKGLSQIIFENNAGWKESTISEVASVVSGGTPDTSIPSFWGGEINWFTPSEIGRAKYVNSSDRTITEKGLKNSSAKLLPPNSLLLSTRATIGECSICQSTCTTNQGFQSLVAILVDYEFLYYLIRTKKSELIKKACGSTFPEISANEVKQLKILVPTINIQKQIANLLMSVDEKITTETKILSAYNLQKQTLLQRLFI